MSEQPRCSPFGHSAHAIGCDACFTARYTGVCPYCSARYAQECRDDDEGKAGDVPEHHYDECPWNPKRDEKVREATETLRAKRVQPVESAQQNEPNDELLEKYVEARIAAYESLQHLDAVAEANAIKAKLLSRLSGPTTNPTPNPPQVSSSGEQNDEQLVENLVTFAIAYGSAAIGKDSDLLHKLHAAEAALLSRLSGGQQSDTPSEHDMIYCAFCGKKIKESHLENTE